MSSFIKWCISQLYCLHSDRIKICFGQNNHEKKYSERSAKFLYDVNPIDFFSSRKVNSLARVSFIITQLIVVDTYWYTRVGNIEYSKKLLKEILFGKGVVVDWSSNSFFKKSRSSSRFGSDFLSWCFLILPSTLCKSSRVFHKYPL